jgi:hypothetical protein
MFPTQQVCTYFASSILVIYCNLMRHLNSSLIITGLTRINHLKSKFRTTELTYIYPYDICLLITSKFSFSTCHWQENTIVPLNHSVPIVTNMAAFLPDERGEPPNAGHTPDQPQQAHILIQFHNLLQ